MLFIKEDSKPEKIRQVDTKFKGFKWVTIYKGDQIDLSEDHGLSLGLVPVKKVKDNSDKSKGQEEKEPQLEPELKKKQVLLYKAKIESIKGVGQKTAKDLIQVYPTEVHLIKALKSDKDIPIRDDLAKLIKRKFKVK